jgi:arsenate reductase
MENMINWEDKDKDTLALIKYTADEGARSPVDFGSAPTEAERRKLEKVLENSQVIKTPVVRNGRASTLGYQPDVWKGWN